MAEASERRGSELPTGYDDVDKAVPTRARGACQTRGIHHVARERRERGLSIVHHDERFVVLNQRFNQCVETPTVDLLLAIEQLESLGPKPLVSREGPVGLVALDRERAPSLVFCVLDEPGGRQ